MTQIMNDANVLSVELDNCTLNIKYPDVTYSYWKGLTPYEDDVDLMYILADLLVSLDVSVEFSGQRLLYTTNMMYEHYVSSYYYYMLHIEDQELYNNCFDKLLEQHIINIQFELDNPIIPKTPKQAKTRKGKPKLEDKFVRQVTVDMFTNKETYIYSNAKTGEIINSDDPDKLKELNAKPVRQTKVKQTKSNVVSMDAMTFSFKKKSND